MKPKKGMKVLTELLNIEGIKVISHRQHEGIEIILSKEFLKVGLTKLKRLGIDEIALIKQEQIVRENIRCKICSCSPCSFLQFPLLVK